MAEPLRAVKGMNDILPPDSARWEWLEDRIRALMQRYGYLNVRTPIVEPTALFVRGLGEVTDIVEKEMYSFVDSMNGDRLSLRPENTAGVVRAMTEHSFLRDGGRRLFYIGAQFRHERPQKGRQRQFHQFGAEALGYAGPDVDAELILMVRALWRELGIVEERDVRLELNSLGQPAERLAHRAALISHFEAHAGELDEDAKRRLHTNPLRILDSKNPAMQALIEAAPKLPDFLGADSLAHFDAVRAVGETGLDFFRTGEEGRPVQEESFRRHIDLAKRLGKTLVIHDRDAHDDVLRVVLSEGAPERWVMHCFSGDAGFARACLDAGAFLSFAGTVTFKNAQHLRDALAVAPPDRVLVETDAPYLTPMPHRGRPNASYLVPLTVRAMAEVRGAELEGFCEAVEAATFAAYGGAW